MDNDKKLEQVLADLPTKVTLTYASYKPGVPAEPEGSVHLAIDDPPPEEVALVLQFCEPGFGFGEVTLVQTAEGVFIDTERTNLKRVKKWFCALIDSAIPDWEQDPERHALYNRVMRSECGSACRVCYPEGENSTGRSET